MSSSFTTSFCCSLLPSYAKLTHETAHPCQERYTAAPLCVFPSSLFLETSFPMSAPGETPVSAASGGHASRTTPLEDDSPEEIPLEIIDFSCTNCFEHIVHSVEKFLTDSFTNCTALREFVSSANAPASAITTCSPPLPASRSRGAAVRPPSKSSEEEEEEEDKLLYSFSPSSVATCGSAARPMVGCGGGTSPLSRVPDAVVIGENFPLGRRRCNGEGSTEDLCVEIHCHDYGHPVGRQFCLPLFLLVKTISQQSTYQHSEACFYLSILSTAAGNALGSNPALTLDMRKATWVSGEDVLPSPYACYVGCMPCFVPLGDSYKQVFDGFSPSCAVTCHPVRKPCENFAGNAAWWSYQSFSTRYQCAAYPKPPERCEYLSDYMDLFQLHMGHRSRVLEDEFDGMCISVRKRFSLTVPWRFLRNRPATVATPTGGVATPQTSMLHTAGDQRRTWRELLEVENRAVLSLCGHHTHAFGTAAPPLQDIQFTFQWNQLHDYEAQDDASKSFLNPFALSNAPSGKEVNRKCSVSAQGNIIPESNIHHGVCGAIREFVNDALNVVRHSTQSITTPETIPVSSTLVDEIASRVLQCSPLPSSSQETLILRLYESVAKLQGPAESISLLLSRSSAAVRSTNSVSTSTDLRSGYFPGSLLSRFAHTCVGQLSDVSDVLHLWRACLATLRRQFDHGGSASLAALLQRLGLPIRDPCVDLSQTLLVQKLQLLSYCIRSMLLQHGETGACGMHHAHRSPERGEEEMNSRLPLREDIAEANMLIGCKEASGVEGSPTRDGGVSRKCLVSNGEPLLAPPAIPPPPTTADMILSRAKEINEMQADDVAQASLTWLQSDTLYNDMCLFLFTNHAQHGRRVRFPDFIQWHSPRDFVLPNVPSENDNDYLSDRMQRSVDAAPSSHVWWAFWDRAVPRPLSLITAEYFHPSEEAASVFRWLEHELSEGVLLLEVVNATFANALHPMLTHRFLISPLVRPSVSAPPRSSSTPAMTIPGLRQYICQKLHAVTTYTLDAVGTLTSTPTQALTDVSFEGIISRYAMALRELEEIESGLCAALTVEALLLDDEEPSTRALISALSTPTAVQPDPNVLGLLAHSVPLTTWSRLVPCFFEASTREPCEMSARLTCIAERPINTAGCFQQLYVEKEATGVVRMALVLSKENI